MSERTRYRITHTPEIFIEYNGKHFCVINAMDKVLADRIGNEQGAKAIALEHASRYYPTPHEYLKTWQAKLSSLYKIREEYI
jgi:hypothetical protein